MYLKDSETHNTLHRGASHTDDDVCQVAGMLSCRTSLTRPDQGTNFCWGTASCQNKNLTLSVVDNMTKIQHIVHTASQAARRLLPSPLVAGHLINTPVQGSSVILCTHIPPAASPHPVSRSAGRSAPPPGAGHTRPSFDTCTCAGHLVSAGTSLSGAPRTSPALPAAHSRHPQGTTEPAASRCCRGTSPGLAKASSLAAAAAPASWPRCWC